MRGEPSSGARLDNRGRVLRRQHQPPVDRLQGVAKVLPNAANRDIVGWFSQGRGDHFRACFSFKSRSAHSRRWRSRT